MASKQFTIYYHTNKFIRYGQYIDVNGSFNIDTSLSKKDLQAILPESIQQLVHKEKEILIPIEAITAHIM